MWIEEDDIEMFLDETLDELMNISLQEHVHNCPHCGLPVRYATVARRSDIETFKLIINSAQEIMNKRGLTFDLLAEVKSECFIAIARKKALNNK